MLSMKNFDFFSSSFFKEQNRSPRDDRVEKLENENAKLENENARYRVRLGIIDIGEAAARMYNNRHPENQTDRLPPFGETDDDHDYYLKKCRDNSCHKVGSFIHRSQKVIRPSVSHCVRCPLRYVRRIFVLNPS